MSLFEFGGFIGDYYEILKVSPLADSKTVKAAYRTLMFKCRFHPDLGGDEESARKINEAYDVLNDPVKRRQYDETLGHLKFAMDRTLPGNFERRRVPRVKVAMNVRYKTFDSDFYPARIKDISYLGCLLQTNEKVEKDTRVVLDISGHIIKGNIRWRRMFHPTVFQRIYEVGVEFEKEFEGLDQISRF